MSNIILSSSSLSLPPSVSLSITAPLSTVPPKWIIEPRDTSILTGKTAVIDCQADGFPHPTVHWTRKEGNFFYSSSLICIHVASRDSPYEYFWKFCTLPHNRLKCPPRRTAALALYSNYLQATCLNDHFKSHSTGPNESGEFKPVISGSHLRVFQNGSLAIHSVQKSDSASYLCQVTNSIGTGLSKVIKLTVHIPAHFKSKFRAETVRKGQDAMIRCEAEGDRPLTISWTKDKNPLRTKDDLRYESSESPTKDGVASEIIIRNAERRDSALFTCIAGNPYGEDETNIQMIMQGKCLHGTCLIARETLLDTFSFFCPSSSTGHPFS